MDRLGIEIAAVSFSYTAGNEEAPTVFQGRASLGGAATPWPKTRVVTPIVRVGPFATGVKILDRRKSVLTA